MTVVFNIKHPIDFDSKNAEKMEKDFQLAATTEEALGFKLDKRAFVIGYIYALASRERGKR